MATEAIAHTPFKAAIYFVAAIVESIGIQNLSALIEFDVCCNRVDRMRAYLERLDLIGVSRLHAAVQPDFSAKS